MPYFAHKHEISAAVDRSDTSSTMKLVMSAREETRGNCGGGLPSSWFSVLWQQSIEDADSPLDDASKFMLLTYHLPITDLRFLLQDRTGKLSRPEWPVPSRGTFVRGFGSVILRNWGGDTYFGGGSKVSETSGVLRFTSSDPEVLLSDGGRFKIDCRFRRFFSFRNLAGKFEFGFSGKKFPSNDPIAIDLLWKGLANLPVNIRFPHPPHSKPAKNALNLRAFRNRVASTLGYCGPELACSYLHASTSSREGVKIENWWVRNSAPMFLMEFYAEEPFLVPRHAQRLDCSDTDVEVYKYVIEQLQTVNYIIRRNNHNKARAKSRALRVALSDYYCYLSSVLELLDALGPKKIDPVNGSKHASRIEQLLKKEEEFLKEIVKKGNRFQVGDKDKMTIPLDIADAQALITKIQNWSATPPGFLLNFLHKITGSVEVTLIPPSFKFSAKAATD